MPGTIVVAATATGVQPLAALLVGGTNILKNIGGGNDFGTPIEGIEVVEAGPGGVSSCTFTIDDPQKAIGLADGLEVIFWNFTSDRPTFRGYVDHWSAVPDFGGQGRRLMVSCTGVEAWLDWYRLGKNIVQTNSPASYFILRVVEAAADAAALRVAYAPVSGLGTRFVGLSYYGGDISGQSVWDGVAAWAVWTVAAGGTLRETITELATHQEFQPTGSGVPIVPMITVDFDLTLRVWPDTPYAGTPLQQPDDYTTLTVGDTPAAALVAENLDFASEPGDVVHEVFVKGGNAAGTGLFGDGTGKRGRQGLINDTTILDAYTAGVRARAYMAGLTPLVRGSFELGPFTPAATVHAGSLLALTNDETNGTGTYRIFEIRKTFLGTGQETWRVAFGGLPPSAVNLIRKLTRAVAA